MLPRQAPSRERLGVLDTNPQSIPVQSVFGRRAPPSKSEEAKNRLRQLAVIRRSSRRPRLTT